MIKPVILQELRDEDAQEIAAMLLAGAALSSVVSVYSAAAERWEALAKKHGEAGNGNQEMACIAIGIALRKVVALAETENARQAPNPALEAAPSI